MKITNTALSLRELTEIPIALPSEEFEIRHIINDGCEAANIKLSPVLVSDSFEILRNFVSSGGGAAILPSKAMHGKDNRSLRITPITDRMIKRTTIDVIALKNRRQSRISRLFTDTLEKTLN
jgi:DNA-binding transcriptional LysR family regulator